jgi:hypothetical protein
LPYEQMDLCRFAKKNNRPADSVARLVGLSVEQVLLVSRDIDARRSATRYLRAVPKLVEEVLEVRPLLHR